MKTYPGSLLVQESAERCPRGLPTQVSAHDLHTQDMLGADHELLLFPVGGLYVEKLALWNR